MGDLGSGLTIGVDVGGTNTDAALVENETHKVLASAKHPTTADISTGLYQVIQEILSISKVKRDQVYQVNIGTTHFVNAVVQRKNLTRVAVIRLCGDATAALPPFCDFPSDILPCVEGPGFLVSGGFEFDGRVNTELDLGEVRTCLEKCRLDGIKNIVVSGVFSPVNSEQETRVGRLIEREFPSLTFTLSHTVGDLGLLERENAAILNESLKPLCGRTLGGLALALTRLDLPCPFYLTQNDGTIISAKKALEFPVLTFASGPTNSMRGAFCLSVEQAAWPLRGC